VVVLVVVAAVVAVGVYLFRASDPAGAGMSTTDVAKMRKAMGFPAGKGPGAR
jgi:hypothetical protein